MEIRSRNSNDQTKAQGEAGKKNFKIKDKY